jgi:tRNA(Phe) wybutosine-synthesizing methylase Tyw3
LEFLGEHLVLFQMIVPIALVSNGSYLYVAEILAGADLDLFALLMVAHELFSNKTWLGAVKKKKLKFDQAQPRIFHTMCNNLD